MNQYHGESVPISVCHVIAGLHVGGAETALYRLLKAVDQERYEMRVISLSDGGSFGPRIADLGVKTTTLDMRAGAWPLSGLLKLRANLKLQRPDVVQCWMYHANFITLLASRSLLRPIPVIWNVRHSLYDLGNESPNTRWVIRATGVLSGLAAGIVYNSELSQKQHEAFGYKSGGALRIANGFDLQSFKPNPDNRRRIRSNLSIPEGATVIGHVGRYHPMKDQATLLRAAARVMRSRPDLHLIMCGKGVDRLNAELQPFVCEFEPSRLHLLAERADVPELMSAMDILCSSSWSEAFPNVLGEAMATEVPCVATDVGDSASIVGDTGMIVPPRDPNALADALDAMLDLSIDQRARLGKQARLRIQQLYSIESVANSYQDLYQSAAAGDR